MQDLLLQIRKDIIKSIKKATQIYFFPTQNLLFPKNAICLAYNESLFLNAGTEFQTVP